ncbi:MAG: hypothetical protein ACRDSJ_16100 [Rubrobacteraceae bacterium]
MNEMEARFNDAFSNWSIRLPPEDVAARRRGKIVEAGWAIWYLFGSDERGEYLDYYASHRMTEDRHVRIHANGHMEDLPAIAGMRMASQDPEEDARLEAEHLAENQRIAKMLEAKGFGIEGDEPGGVQINRFLRISEPRD